MTTESQRTITVEQQVTCDQCNEPRTVSCTDAIETEQGWTNKIRNGCKYHPVSPRVFTLSGKSLTIEEWNASH